MSSKPDIAQGIGLTGPICPLTELASIVGGSGTVDRSDYILQLNIFYLICVLTDLAYCYLSEVDTLYSLKATCT